MSIATYLLVCLLAAGQPASERGTISGVVVDGSAQQAPLAGVEVVLCLDDAGQTIPVESTTSDAAGRFLFADLPTDENYTYLPGANRHDVHYPGPRIRLDAENSSAEVKLIAYNTSAECPLVIRSHDMRVRTEKGILYVSESLTVDNPSRKTYVGQSLSDMPPVTLRLSIPDDFEKVTFKKEFYGRQFMVLDGRVLTSLPWPPGERKLEFTYVLPVEQRHRFLRRRIDLPTAQLSVRIESNTKCNACNLPDKTIGENGDIVYVSHGEPLPAGRMLELQLGELPVPVMSYAKWVALVLLGGLLAASLRLLKDRTPAISPDTLSRHRGTGIRTVAPPKLLGKGAKQNQRQLR